MSDKNTVEIHANRIKLAFEPDSERITAIRMLAGSHGGAAIQTGGGIWRCHLPLAAKDEVARLFVSLKWCDSFRKLMKNSPAKMAPAGNVINGKILQALGDLRAPLQDGRKLYKHQIDGLEFLAKTPRAMLFDDMGLGKTLQALLVSRAIYEVTRAHTVVITKSGLINDWREEAERIKHPVLSCYSWAKIPAPSAGQHYCMIADECHFAQSLESNRGKAFQEWAEVADFVILLSGTPLMDGKHVDMFPLLKAIRHDLARDRNAYEKRYCGRARITIGAKIDEDAQKIYFTCKACKASNAQRWHYSIKSFSCRACGEKFPAPKSWTDKSKSTNGEELKTAIAPFMLRRLKSECLDLPKKTRIIRHVEVTGEMQDAYDEAVEKARVSFFRRLAEGKVAASGLAFSTLAIIRKAASLAKVAAAIELAEEAISEGSQPIVFAEFVDTVKAVAAHFKVEPYTGETPTKPIDKKTKIVKDFQAGLEHQRLFVGTREAGGTGLNLTAANTIIAIDRPMRPGDIDQAEDRAHRIGQHWPLSAYWLRAFPICERIDGFIESKRKVINRLLGDNAGEEKEEGNAAAILGSLFEWAKPK